MIYLLALVPNLHEHILSQIFSQGHIATLVIKKVLYRGVVLIENLLELTQRHAQSELRNAFCKINKKRIEQRERIDFGRMKIFLVENGVTACNNQNQWYLCIPKRRRALSSVGSEHLVYTEGVGGSNPSAPTSSADCCDKNQKNHQACLSGFFGFYRPVLKAQYAVSTASNLHLQ